MKNVLLKIAEYSSFRPLFADSATKGPKSDRTAEGTAERTILKLGGKTLKMPKITFISKLGNYRLHYLKYVNDIMYINKTYIYIYINKLLKYC